MPLEPLVVSVCVSKYEKMCGRITQKSPVLMLGLHIVRPDRTADHAPRFNGAPRREHWVLRRNPKTAEYALDPLLWGLIPHWCEDPNGGRRPINAKVETISSLPTFREAYMKRRCLVPVDSFFEWKAIPGVRPKRPYAIGKKSGDPFALAGIWENGADREPRSGCEPLPSSRVRRTISSAPSITGCP